MDLSGEDSIIEDHLNKCRCCFRLLINEHKNIDKDIEEKFFLLTQISVIS